jgi:WD40 repeat protein
LQHGDAVWAAVYDPKGERVVTASADKTARIWDARTGEPIGKPLQHGDAVWAAVYDPKGERVVTASADKTARIWRAPPTGQTLVEEIRANLGPNAPEPLKLPDSAVRKEDYGTLMALGAQTIWSRAKSLFESN